MKFLFVIDNSYDKNGPTQMLTRRLCQAVSEEGHSVDLIDFQAGGETRTVPLNGVNVMVFHRFPERQVADFFSPEDLGSLKKTGLLRKLISNPRWLRTLFLWKVSRRNLNQFDIQSEIESACQNNNYDFVVASSAPHYVSFALSDARIKSKKVIYLCDPYFLGEYFNTPSDYKMEKQLYKRIAMAFVTQFMYDGYPNSVFEKYISKIRALSLPGIQKNTFDVSAGKREASYIDCVYVGNFYWLIRRPDYLLDLFMRINSPKLRLILVIGGPLYNFPEDYFDKITALLGERFVRLGPVPYDEAYAAIQNADVLINLGNTNSNMLPSKIFDYFSSCKPILNISSISNDPALIYLQKYPLAHTVFTNDSVDDVSQGVRSFCENAPEEKLSFEDVEERFRANTPAAVAKEFLQGLGLPTN